VLILSHFRTSKLLLKALALVLALLYLLTAICSSCSFAGKLTNAIVAHSCKLTHYGFWNSTEVKKEAPLPAGSLAWYLLKEYA